MLTSTKPSVVGNRSLEPSTKPPQKNCKCGVLLVLIVQIRVQYILCGRNTTSAYTLLVLTIIILACVLKTNATMIAINHSDSSEN